jgi:hypothetical protein
LGAALAGGLCTHLVTTAWMARKLLDRAGKNSVTVNVGGGKV